MVMQTVFAEVCVNRENALGILALAFCGLFALTLFAMMLIVGGRWIDIGLEYVLKKNLKAQQMQTIT